MKHQEIAQVAGQEERQDNEGLIVPVETEKDGQPNQEARPDTAQSLHGILGKIASSDDRLKSLQSDLAQIETLEAQHDIAPGDRTAIKTEIETIMQNIQNDEQQRKALMKSMLNSPDGEPVSSETQSISKLASVYEKVAGKEAAREMRQEFVQQFIEDTSDDLCKELIRDQENAEEARLVLKGLIASEVLTYAEDFIENGGEPNFGYEVYVEYAKYDTEGGSKQYVTDFQISSYRGTRDFSYSEATEIARQQEETEEEGTE